MINEKQRKILSEFVKQYNHLYHSEPDLKKYSEYAMTYHSTAIEGSTLTGNEVIELLDIGKPAKRRKFMHNLYGIRPSQGFVVYQTAKCKEKITGNRYKISVRW